MASCKWLGHKFSFVAEGATMRWECQRGCGAGGSKTYPTAEAAQRYARALDRRDAEDVGKRPLLSLLPIWLARKMGERRAGASRRR